MRTHTFFMPNMYGTFRFLSIYFYFIQYIDGLVVNPFNAHGINTGVDGISKEEDCL